LEGFGKLSLLRGQTGVGQKESDMDKDEDHGKFYPGVGIKRLKQRKIGPPSYVIPQPSAGYPQKARYKSRLNPGSGDMDIKMTSLCLQVLHFKGRHIDNLYFRRTPPFKIFR